MARGSDCQEVSNSRENKMIGLAISQHWTALLILGVGTGPRPEMNRRLIVYVVGKTYQCSERKQHRAVAHSLRYISGKNAKGIK